MDGDAVQPSKGRKRKKSGWDKHKARAKKATILNVASLNQAADLADHLNETVHQVRAERDAMGLKVAELEAQVKALKEKASRLSANQRQTKRRLVLKRQEVKNLNREVYGTAMPSRLKPIGEVKDPRTIRKREEALKSAVQGGLATRLGLSTGAVEEIVAKWGRDITRRGTGTRTKKPRTSCGGWRTSWRRIRCQVAQWREC